jgi:hypothetical protein
MFLVIWDPTATASYKQKGGRPGVPDKLIIHQAAVKSAVEALRARIAQQIHIAGIYKIQMDFQILYWANKAGFKRELSLESLVSKKPLLRIDILLKEESSSFWNVGTQHVSFITH